MPRSIRAPAHLRTPLRHCVRPAERVLAPRSARVLTFSRTAVSHWTRMLSATQGRLAPPASRHLCVHCCLQPTSCSGKVRPPSGPRCPSSTAGIQTVLPPLSLDFARFSWARPSPAPSSQLVDSAGNLSTYRPLHCSLSLSRIRALYGGYDFRVVRRQCCLLLTPSGALCRDCCRTGAVQSDSHLRYSQGAASSFEICVSPFGHDFCGHPVSTRTPPPASSG